MWDIFSKLRNLLDRREQSRALLLLAMILASGFVESVRVASIVPFVAVIADASVLESNPYLAAAYRWWGFESPRAFLFVLGLGVLVLTLGSLAFTALTSWATIRFSTMRNYRLSRDLFAIYLSHPYEWFLSRHSADLGRSALDEVKLVIGCAVMPFLSLITGCVMGTFMVGLLIIADPLLAVIVTLALGGGYALIYLASRKYLTRIGEERVEANRQRYRISLEAFGAIKDVKALGLEKTFFSRFEQPSRRFVTRQAASSVIGQMPQYGIQALAFTIVLLIVWYQLAVHEDVSRALPVIALYAVAGSRLMPALQKIYASVSKLRYARPALDALHRDLTEVHARDIRTGKDEPAQPLGLKKELKVSEVSYRYPGSTTQALHGVSLRVPAGAAVGLVGQTGAGKTTLVDVILGLLEPESGLLSVDGVPVTEANRRAWQRTIGYVPQDIFLADNTVAANIAFGVAPRDIDMAAVERAARIANLHDFVTDELEQEYSTLVGERGVRLSGGQRQRIGIARALYRDPDLLIMDEGTSALDNITERAVMEAVNNLARAKTIILIAHRLTTVRTCDCIFLLEHGRLSASGTYDELVTRSKRFGDMVASLA
jgi:ABC-type bacteriocin/lantibiotic exporter with double-glycine peptidase domain